MNSLRSLLVPALLVLGPSLLGAQEVPAPPVPGPTAGDCLSEATTPNNQMQFFVCLNSKREACQDQLLTVMTECGEDSAKYRGVFQRYQELRASSNVLLDTVISELKFQEKVNPERVRPLFEAVNRTYLEFQAYSQKTLCSGETTKVLPAFIPAIGSWVAEKAQFVLSGWFAGQQAKRKEKAEQLTQQRWKSPKDFGATFPARPAARH